VDAGDRSVQPPAPQHCPEIAQHEREEKARYEQKGVVGQRHWEYMVNAFQISYSRIKEAVSMLRRFWVNGSFAVVGVQAGTLHVTIKECGTEAT